MSDDDDKPLTKAEREQLQRLAERAMREEKRRTPPKPYKQLGAGLDLTAFQVRTYSEEELRAHQEEVDAKGIPCIVHGAEPYQPCTYEGGMNPRNCAARVRAWRAGQRERQAAAERQGRLTLAERLRRVGVPEKHLKIVESGLWKEKPSLKIAKRFYTSSYQGLFLAGDTGRGKSGAACWIASQGPRLRRGPVIWVRASMLGTVDLWERAPSQANAEEDEQPRRRRVTWDDLLEAQLKVLDDIGTGRLVADAKFRDRLVDLLAASFDNEQEVVMTGNCSKDEFQQLIVPQVWDRIEKWCMWEETGGDSFRETAACKETP